MVEEAPEIQTKSQRPSPIPPITTPSHHTNIIRHTSMSPLPAPLLLYLPRLIPSNRLANITSIEMVIDTHRTDNVDDELPPCYNVDHLKPILDNIATHCRRLHTLCVSFTLYSRVFQHLILDDPALPMVDAFLQSKPLRRMRVELPAHAYSAAGVDGPSTPAHPREALAKGPFKHSYWRSLDGEEPVIQWRSLERYPLPPLRLPDDSVESRGYWIAEGDWGPQILVSNCGI